MEIVARKERVEAGAGQGVGLAFMFQQQSGGGAVESHGVSKLAQETQKPAPLTATVLVRGEGER